MHFLERLTGHIAGALAPFGDDAAHEVAILLELPSAFADHRDLGDDGIGQPLLAIETSNAGRSAALLHPLQGVRIRVNLVKLPRRAFFGVAWIGTTDARRICLHRLDLLDDRIRILPQSDRVAVRLGHFATVQPRHFRCRGQQGFRLYEDAATGPLEIADQALAIGERQTGVAIEERACFLERAYVTLLLIKTPQLHVATTVSTAQAPQSLFHLQLEVAFLAVQVVEPTRHLAGDLDVGNLVLADRNEGRLVEQNVCAL